MGEINLPSALYESEPEHSRVLKFIPTDMPKSLYSPKLSDDVVRTLYRGDFAGGCR